MKLFGNTDRDHHNIFSRVERLDRRMARARLQLGLLSLAVGCIILALLWAFR